MTIRDGDFYINNSNQDFYLRENGVWVRKGNIRDEGSSGLVGVAPVLGLGFNVGVQISRTRFIESLAEDIGFDMVVELSRIRDIAPGSQQFGLAMDAILNRVRELTTPVNCGLGMDVVLTVFASATESIAVSMTTGFSLSLSAALSRTRSLTIADALGLNLSVSALSHTAVPGSLLTWGDGTSPYADVLDEHLAATFTFDSAPPSLIQACAISPDGTLLAFGTTTSVLVYSVVGTSLTQVFSETGYTGVGPVAMCFSPDSSKLMVSTGLSSGTTLKTFNTTSWSTVTSPSLSTLARNIDWSTGFIAIALDVSPYLRVYRASDLVEISFTPAIATVCRSARIRPGDGYIAAIDGNAGLYVYDTSTWAKLSAPATPPSGTVVAIQNVLVWNADGSQLALGTSTSPFLWVYSLSGTTLTKLSNPASLPPNTVRALAFTGDKANLFVGFQDTSTNPRLYRYGISGSTLTKQTNPSVQPNANPFCIATNINTVS